MGLDEITISKNLGVSEKSIHEVIKNLNYKVSDYYITNKEQSNYDYKIDTSSLHDLTWESQEIKLNLIYQNLINIIGDSK